METIFCEPERCGCNVIFLHYLCLTYVDDFISVCYAKPIFWVSKVFKPLENNGGKVAQLKVNTVLESICHSLSEYSYLRRTKKKKRVNAHQNDLQV